jgi:hypothetical protein
MLAKVSTEKTLMDHNSSQTKDYLIVNRVQVLNEACCNACGGGFTASPMGDKALIATIDDGNRTYFFCGGCGDNISGRLESDEARRHYVWDWAIPLRNGHQPQS